MNTTCRNLEDQRNQWTEVEKMRPNENHQDYSPNIHKNPEQVGREEMVTIQQVGSQLLPPHPVKLPLFEGHIKKWCHTFPATSIHSFNHMIKELGYDFVFYDRKALNHKILNCEKHMTNLLCIFMIVYVITVLNFSKTKVTGNF